MEGCGAEGEEAQVCNLRELSIRPFRPHCLSPACVCSDASGAFSVRPGCLAGCLAWPAHRSAARPALLPAFIISSLLLTPPPPPPPPPPRPRSETDTVSCLSRIWCVYEVFCTVRADRELVMMFPEDERRRFLEALAETSDAPRNALAQVDVDTAESFDPSDKERIMGEVEEVGGAAKVNEVVIAALNRALVDVAIRAAEEDARRCTCGAALI